MNICLMPIVHAADEAEVTTAGRSWWPTEGKIRRS